MTSRCLGGQNDDTLIPLMSISGQLDLCLDAEEPYVKVVCANIAQQKSLEKDTEDWENQGGRSPSIEENVNVTKQHKAYSKKTRGFTFGAPGPAMEALYRESEDDPVHSNESIRMKAMEKVFVDGRKSMADYKESKTWAY